jgi:hypothetical protein
VAAAFKMVAYGVPVDAMDNYVLAYGVDAMDNYVCVGESIALQCLRKFVVTVVEVFRPEYLRLPNK